MTLPATPDLALFVLSVLAKGGLLLAGVAVAAWLLRDRAAAFRHAVWAVGLGALLCLPVAEGGLPPWTRIEIVSSTAASSRSIPPAGTMTALETTSPAPTGASREHARTQPQNEREMQPSVDEPDPAKPEGGAEPTVARSEAIGAEDVLGGFLLAWGTGVGAHLLWMAGGWICIRRWIARSDRVTDPAWADTLTAVCRDLGVWRTIRLYRSPDVAVPMTAGVLRPVILVPAQSDEWPDARRRTVLTHEVAHVARGDYGTNLLARWACALHWVNPLVWWAARKLRAERERACDDRVLGTGIAGPDYAEHLVAVAREAVRSHRWGGALAMARPSELKGRVQSILSSTTPRQALSRAQGTGLIAAALTMMLAVAVLAPDPVAADAPSADETALRPPNADAHDADAHDADAPDADSPDADFPGAGTPVLNPLDPESVEAPEFAPATDQDEVAPSADPDDRPPAGPVAAADTTDEDATGEGATGEGTTGEGTEESAETSRRDLEKRAVFAISQMSSDRAVPRLTDIARTNPDVEIRKKAIFHLGDHETEDVARTLREFAVEDADAEVQKRALFALSQLPEPLGRPQLVEIGRTHPDIKIREKAVFWLQAYGSEAAVDALRRFVFESDRTGVQEQAVFALSQTGAETAVPILVEIARTHPSPDVRKKAVTSLGRFDTPAALDALMQIVNEE